MTSADLKLQKFCDTNDLKNLIKELPALREKIPLTLTLF